jgi:hypothetical protein
VARSGGCTIIISIRGQHSLCVHGQTSAPTSAGQHRTARALTPHTFVSVPSTLPKRRQASPRPPGKAAVATYGLFVLGTSAAWNIFMLALRLERGLLKSGVSPELIASTRRRVALGFVIYLVAAGLALVNAYLGFGIITAMWGLWAVIAYWNQPSRTMVGRRVERAGRRRLRTGNSDGLVARSSLRRRPRQSDHSLRASFASACAGARSVSIRTFPAIRRACAIPSRYANTALIRTPQGSKMLVVHHGVPIVGGFMVRELEARQGASWRSSPRT